MSVKTNGSVVLAGRAIWAPPVSLSPPESSIIQLPGLDQPVCIRSLKPSDRGDIFRLCCDTGFLGHGMDELFKDRDLFADLFTRPYLVHEPECAFVVEAEGRIVAYLLGSVSPHFERYQMMSGFHTSMRMVLRLVAGHYAGHPRSRKFIRWLFTTAFREQPKHPPHAAHLHFEVDKEYRAKGLARAMWNFYERRLIAAGIKMCYGIFFSHPSRRPEVAYTRFGFSVYDRRRTTMFEPEITDPIDVVCVAKTL